LLNTRIGLLLVLGLFLDSGLFQGGIRRLSSYLGLDTGSILAPQV
jgi:hypothetical protein